MSRKITFLTLFLWLMTVTLPVIAQQKTDTTYTFRFVPQKDMFYVPWNGNDTELARLLECIENSKATRVRDNILKSKEQKTIQPTKGGHKMVTYQNYVSLFYCQITSCPSDGGIS